VIAEREDGAFDVIEQRGGRARAGDEIAVGDVAGAHKDQSSVAAGRLLLA